MSKLEQHFTRDSFPCSLKTTLLLFSLFLWNTGLAFTSLKRPTDLKPKVSSFYPSSVSSKNQNLLLVLTLFWLIMHVLCHFNFNLLKFSSWVYDIYKHMYKQFAFSCFGDVCLRHRNA